MFKKTHQPNIREVRNMKKLYKCMHCGNIIEMVEDKGVPVVCCGEKMVLLDPNTTDAATEKHVPVVTRFRQRGDGKRRQRRTPDDGRASYRLHHSGNQLGNPKEIPGPSRQAGSQIRTAGRRKNRLPLTNTAISTDSGRRISNRLPEIVADSGIIRSKKRLKKSLSNWYEKSGKRIFTRARLERFLFPFFVFFQIIAAAWL